MNAGYSNRTPGQNLTAILRRRWMIVAASVVLTALAAYAFSKAQTPKYKATATLLELKNPQQLVDNLTQANTSQPSTFDLTTGKGLASLRVVAQQASAAMRGRLSPDEIRSRVAIASDSSSADASSALVNITATDTDPRLAAQTATTFSQTFIAFLKAADQSAYTDAARLVSDRLNSLQAAHGPTSEVQTLQTRLNDLRNLAALQTGGLKLVQPAETPKSQVSPRPARNAALGIIGGLILGIALALGVDALDRRVRDSDEFEHIFRRPILGHIPESRGIEGQGQGLNSLRAPDVEAFRILRANLRYAAGSGRAKRLLVTSATPGEGKSTIAWNLALIAARGGGRVLLIEADLRQPKITARYMGASKRVGLSHVLSGQASPEEALIDYSDLADTSTLGGEFGQLCVMLAGGTPPNPAELLDSPEMGRMLDQLTEHFDLVIIDAPPPSVVADPIPLFRLVDGVIVVGRLNYSDRRALAQHRDQLESIGASVVGLAINGVEVDGKSGYASYY
jgi:capsular exopolysaccharide synthesis family protein